MRFVARRVSVNIARLVPPKRPHGTTTTQRRAGPHLDAGAKGRVVVQERLSRRHAAAHDPLGGHRVPAGRRAGGDRALHRRQDRHHHRRGAHFRHPRLRALSHHARRRAGGRLHHPRKQLHAVDRDRRGLHGGADDLQPRRLHDGDRQDHPVVAHGHVDVHRVDHRRAARVPDEAALHQRGATAVSGRTRERGGARCALHGRGQRGHVQGAAARLHGALHRPLPGAHQRRLDEPAAVQDPAHAPVGRNEGAVDLPRAAGFLLLRGSGQGEPVHPDDPRHGHPHARAAPHARRRDAGRGRPHGHRGRDQLPARRVHQLRDPRADHDPGGRHRRPHRAHRRRGADLARRDREPVVAVVGRDDDGGGLARQPARRVPRSSRASSRGARRATAPMS